MGQSQKQREIALRDERIRLVARETLGQSGYHGLSMDRIAEVVGCSKGTVYQHFTSKEDLIAALAVETCAKRTAMFQRAIGFRGRHRERVAAVGVADKIFVALYPDHFQVETLMDIDSIFDKASPQRREQMVAIKSRMMDALVGLVEDAETAGDLPGDPNRPPCQVLYGLWTMSMGHNILQTSPTQTEHFLEQPTWLALWANYNMLLDGYGWRPLSTEHDYQATVQRAIETVFWDEQQRLAERDLDLSAGQRPAAKSEGKS